MSIDHLLSLAGMYAEAHGKAERFRALAETRPARRAEYQAGADRWTAATAGLRANLRAELRDALGTTVYAVPDEALPVCTRDRRFVDIRAAFVDGERGVRVRYTLAQAVSAGAAMIACAAVADGGTLEAILPAFPPDTRLRATTPPPGPAPAPAPGSATPDGDIPDAGNPSMIGDHPAPGAARGVACPGLADSCRTDPHHVGVLDRLNLRVYPPESTVDATEYVVLDLFGVSIGLRRREHDLYLHLDTTETADQVIAVEINGGGEVDHPIT